MLLRRLRLLPTKSIQRDVLFVALEGHGQVEVQRIRDPRAKRIKLSVDERGARLTLPLRASLASGERFLQEHDAWLATQLEKYASAEDSPPLSRNLTDCLPLRGESVPLLWREGRFTRLELQEGQLHFHVSPRASDTLLRRALREFYEAHARADIGRWLPRYLPALPRAPTRVRIKVMSSQWGSLSPDGSLALDLALVLGRPSAFEYVLVHELCHLLQANHSPAFWHEVETRFPNWRDERQYFHSQGRQLKASIRALLSARSNNAT